MAYFTPFRLAVGLMLACTQAAFVRAADPTAVPAVSSEKMSYAPYLSPGKLTIVASFDGGESFARWDDTLAFARENNVKFTYFVSGVQFVPDADRKTYLYPPDPQKKGQSIIGFGGKKEEVENRIAVVKEAVAEGHDVQCHLNGHFTGLRWDEAAWRLEFSQFQTFTRFLPAPARHVRFPMLAYGPSAYPALAEAGYAGIFSVDKEDFKTFRRVSVPRPDGAVATLYEFPIPYTILGGFKLMFMDYNFYVADKSQGRAPQECRERMVKLYLEEAEKCLKQRRPFFISHHFTHWQNGAYWEAMKETIATLQKNHAVEFLTVSELHQKITAPPAVVQTPVIPAQ
jgi:peptidoglycan/xylan/chitin deacetylase (PgdA/CDA1 family)